MEPDPDSRPQPPRAASSLSDSAQGWAASHRGSVGLIVAAAFVVVCAGVRAAAPILAPTVLGAYVATVNMPIVTWLQRRRLPLTLSVALVLTLDAVALVGFSALLLGSTSQLSERVPHYFTLLQDKEERFFAWLQELGIQSSVMEVIDPRVAVQFVAGLAGDLAGLMWEVTLSLIIAAFLLLRFGRIGEQAGASILLRSPGARRALSEVNRYIAVKTATSMATGALIGLWVWLTGGELPILFGVLAFALNYVPNLGSIVAAVPAITLGLLGGGWGEGLLLTMGYVGINVVIGNIIEPRVMARALGLYPLAVLLSVLFWGSLLGATGAVLSSILTVIAKMALLESEDLRQAGFILGPRRSLLPDRPAPGDLLEEALPKAR